MGHPSPDCGRASTFHPTHVLLLTYRSSAISTLSGCAPQRHGCVTADSMRNGSSRSLNVDMCDVPPATRRRSPPRPTPHGRGPGSSWRCSNTSSQGTRNGAAARDPLLLAARAARRDADIATRVDGEWGGRLRASYRNTGANPRPKRCASAARSPGRQSWTGVAAPRAGRGVEDGNYRNRGVRLYSLGAAPRRCCRTGCNDDLGVLLREVGGVSHLLGQRRLRQTAVGHGLDGH